MVLVGSPGWSCTWNNSPTLGLLNTGNTSVPQSPPWELTPDWPDIGLAGDVESAGRKCLGS